MATASTTSPAYGGERIRSRLLQVVHGRAQRAARLGPVLGAYHPAVEYNVRRLRSGLDEVSFHMSGTEAVMQAVRLARYHTTQSPRALLRRLPWVVGGRAAGGGQPAAQPHDTR